MQAKMARVQQWYSPKEVGGPAAGLVSMTQLLPAMVVIDLAESHPESSSMDTRVKRRQRSPRLLKPLPQPILRGGNHEEHEVVAQDR